MEEEYRCALKSSSQERARLESWAERLEGELLDERHSHALRYRAYPRKTLQQGFDWSADDKSLTVSL